MKINFTEGGKLKNRDITSLIRFLHIIFHRIQHQSHRMNSPEWWEFGAMMRKGNWQTVWDREWNLTYQVSRIAGMYQGPGMWRARSSARRGICRFLRFLRLQRWHSLSSFSITNWISACSSQRNGASMSGTLAWTFILVAKWLFGLCSMSWARQLRKRKMSDCDWKKSTFTVIVKCRANRGLFRSPSHVMCEVCSWFGIVKFSEFIN